MDNMATRSEKPLRFSQIDAETVTKGLARNVHFVSSLMESGVEFVAVDFPQANRLTIHILAAVAEHEAKAISERTKAALAAAKARNVKLGGFRGHVIDDGARRASLATRRAVSAARAADIAPVIAELRASGVTIAPRDCISAARARHPSPPRRRVVVGGASVAPVSSALIARWRRHRKVKSPDAGTI